jgi:hypothetical protein
MRIESINLFMMATISFSVVVIFLIPSCKYQQRKEWFFYRTISDWNRPSQTIVVNSSVKTFKAAVSSIKYLLMKHVNSLSLLSIVICNL